MRSLLMLSFAAVEVAAQSTAPKMIESDPIIGVRAQREWFSDSTVRRSCPAFVLRDRGPSEFSHEELPLRSGCSVDTTVALPDADGAKWMTVVYSRWSEFPAEPGRRSRRGPAPTRDTVRLLTSVLYSKRDLPLAWRPEWLGTVAFTYVRWIQAETAPRPDGSMLTGIRYCFNGTGGCWQHFMRRMLGTWAPVTEQFWKQFPATPDGRIGKGPGVDLATLTGSYGLYSNADGNCCPSRELVFALEQRGDSLLLKGQEIRKTP